VALATPSGERVPPNRVVLLFNFFDRLRRLVPAP
jgi:hypothetical protein